MILAKKSISLKNHSENIFQKCLKQINNLNFDLIKNKYNLTEQKIVQLFLYIAFFHDLGKVSPSFQKILNSKNDFSEKENDLSEKGKKDFLAHNKLSFILFNQLTNLPFNKKEKKLIEYAILYHHAKFFFDNEQIDLNVYKDIKDKGIDLSQIFTEEVFINIENYLTEFNLKNHTLLSLDREIQEELKNIIYPDFKYKFNEINLEKIEEEALNSLIRILFNQSDREVSKEEIVNQSSKKKKDMINNQKDLINKNVGFNTFSFDVDYYLSMFEKKFNQNNERGLKQKNIENKILNFFLKKGNNKKEVDKKQQNNFVILDGAPGCGKTKMFLSVFHQLYKNNKVKRMYIITPRNNIAKSLYLDFTQTEKYYHLNGSVSIEIINSEEAEKTVIGKTIKEVFDLNKEDCEKEKYQSDIVLLSVDHLIKLYNDIQHQHLFFDIMNNFCVFDEFHEIFEQPLLQIYFVEILKLFNLYNNNYSLLVSGTPNYFFLNYYFNMNIEENNIFELESFNDKKIEISFLNKKENDEDSEEKNKFKTLLLNKKKDGFISIFNTAKEAKLHTISFLDDLKDDVNNESVENVEKGLNKKEEEKNTIYCFHSHFDKKDKNKLFNEILEDFQSYNKNLLFSGPIIQASLDITTKNMFCELSSAENTIQRIGRLNRFGENELSWLCLIEEEKKNKTELFYQLKKEFKKYFTYILSVNKEDLENNEIKISLTLNELRKIYQDFEKRLILKDKNFKKAFFENIFLKAEKILKNYNKTPVRFNFNQNNKDENKVRILNNTLRGEVGVNLALYEVNALQEKNIQDTLLKIKQHNLKGNYKDKTLCLNCTYYENDELKQYLNNLLMKNNEKIKLDFLYKTELFSKMFFYYDYYFGINKKSKTKKELNLMKKIQKNYVFNEERLKFCSQLSPIPAFYEDGFIYLNYNNVNIGYISTQFNEKTKNNT